MEKACKYGKEGFTIIDSSLAAQNLMTAGKIVGYDSTICALYPMKELEAKFAEAFNIPEGVLPICTITFGKKHPECVISDVEKYHEEKVHRGKWWVPLQHVKWYHLWAAPKFTPSTVQPIGCSTNKKTRRPSGHPSKYQSTGMENFIISPCNWHIALLRLGQQRTFSVCWKYTKGYLSHIRMWPAL